MEQPKLNINNPHQNSLVEILKNYRLSKSLNKLPRFFHAKTIELLDKFSSSLVYFGLGLTMGLEGLFDETLSYHNLYITLKDSTHFKQWHREVEDFFDSTTRKMQDLLEKFGAIAYCESDNAEDVREYMQYITSDVFYNSLNSHIMDKNRGYLAKNLFEVGKALQKAHGWHHKDGTGGDGIRDNFIKNPRSKSVRSSRSDVEISDLNPRRYIFSVNKLRSNSSTMDRVPKSAKEKALMSKRKKKYFDYKGRMMRYTFEGSDLAKQRKKILFQLNKKNYDMPRKNKLKIKDPFKKKSSLPDLVGVDPKKRLKKVCQRAIVTQNAFTAKSELILLNFVLEIFLFFSVFWF